MYRNYLENLRLDEIIMYLRKSRADDALMSVEEVLEKHEAILDDFTERMLGGKIQESNRYREVVSGESIESREIFRHILKLCESRKYKAIIVADLQRLGRPDLHDIGYIERILRFTNMIIITPQKSYCLEDKYDRDAFEREMMRGNDYLEYIKSIMGAGKRLSCSQGWYVAGLAPYGYEKVWVTDGKRRRPTLAIIEEEANVVRMIFDMYANQNMGKLSICRHLEKLKIKPPQGEHWHADSIRHILQNVHFIGKVKWQFRKVITTIEDGEIQKKRPINQDFLLYDGKHEAIISDELFQKVQDKFGKMPKTKSTNTLRNPLASLVFCQCGRTMLLKKNQRYERLMCNNQVHCHTTSANYSEVIDLVIMALQDAIEDFKINVAEDNTKAIERQKQYVKMLENKLTDLQARELSMWETQSNPDASLRMPPHIFKQLNERILLEKKDTEDAIVDALKDMPPQIDFEQTIATFTDAIDALKSPDGDAADKNRLLKACIEKITYNRESRGSTIKLEVKLRV